MGSGRSIRETYDWQLIILYLLLIFIGWVNIYASVHGSGVSGIFDFSANCGKQFIWMMTAIVIGSAIIFVVSPNLWDSGAFLFYSISIILLIAVIFLGIEVKGSRSWFEFGPVRFQPAEISKITTSLLLAYVMSRAGFSLRNGKNFMTAAAIIIVPMLIIMAEQETGSALVYAGFIFVLYREGLSGWLIAMIGLASLLFILTLTTSPYVSVLVLVGIITFCNALNSKKVIRWFLIYAVAIAALAFIPEGLSALHPEGISSLQPEGISGGLPDGMPSLHTEENSAANESSTFFTAIKPIYILLGICALALPFIVSHAYRTRNSFTLLSVLVFIAGIALIFSSEFAFENILQDHQRKRIEVLLGMTEDPSGVGYNVNQSMIAIGSGGLLGKGYLGGTQTTYGFVPEQSTDFIFCTVGEEWGFVGCLVVISLYVMLILRIMKDAEESRDSFTRIYGFCLVSCLFMHLFINIGMTIGIMPVIGIPLPFMSYGGSSLWAFTIMLAIFIALDHREKKYF